jgi:mono/diheme cytochrome c family protein
MNQPRRQGWRLSFCLIFLTVGCDLPGKPNPADRPVPPNQVTNFEKLYTMHCAGCHGTDGKLGPAPPLNDSLFLTIVPDTDLLRVITEGRHVTPAQKTPMPAFADAKGGPLTADQVRILAQGIKPRWGADAGRAGSAPPYLAPEAGGGNKEAGARVFSRACAGCHGDKGQGGNYQDRVVGAINDQVFLALISDQALRRLVITGRPDLGMPAFDKPEGRPADFQALSSVEIDDLVALLAYWRLGGSSNGK